MKNLLHELVGCEGNGLWWDTADVVEGQAAVQAFLYTVLAVHMLEGFGEAAAQRNIKKEHISDQVEKNNNIWS